ncbi:MAG: DUF1638 domain-containing protein, partial [Candidatus Nanopelagicales bacterium]
MSSPSPARQRVALIGCGALSTDITAICEQRGWDVDLHPLPPLLHNQPRLIAPRVEELIIELRETYGRIAIAYADCGTYGALDEVCARHGVERLAGDHCYDLYAGAEDIAELSAQEPGTYFLTDFLVTGFDRLVWRELGLDRHPDLRDDYFRHYRRVMWLAGRDTPDMRRAAERAAGRLGLPLEVREITLAGPGRAGSLTTALAAVL